MHNLLGSGNASLAYLERHPTLYSNEDNHIFWPIHSMFCCISLTPNTGIGIPNGLLRAWFSPHGQSLL